MAPWLGVCVWGGGISDAGSADGGGGSTGGTWDDPEAVMGVVGTRAVPVLVIGTKTVCPRTTFPTACGRALLTYAAHLLRRLDDGCPASSCLLPLLLAWPVI